MQDKFEDRVEKMDSLFQIFDAAGRLGGAYLGEALIWGGAYLGKYVL